MQILEIRNHKKRYLPLLLLADEQEDMIDRYLERGTLYVLTDGGGDAKGACVVTDEGDGVLEIKNLATAPQSRRKGYGKALVGFIENRYRGAFSVLQVGTGESPLTLPFYLKCGFRFSHRIPNFFTEHYDHPILMSSGVKDRGCTRLTGVKPQLLMRRSLRPTKVRMKAPNGDSLRKKSL